MVKYCLLLFSCHYWIILVSQITLVAIVVHCKLIHFTALVVISYCYTHCSVAQWTAHSVPHYFKLHFTGAYACTICNILLLESSLNEHPPQQAAEMRYWQTSNCTSNKNNKRPLLKPFGCKVMTIYITHCYCFQTWEDFWGQIDTSKHNGCIKVVLVRHWALTSGILVEKVTF